MASIILTFVFYPLYKRIQKSLKYENLSVLITLVLIIIIFLMPFIFVASQIPKQAAGIYDYAKENMMDKDFFDLSCENVESIKCNVVNFATGSGYFDFEDIINRLFQKITELATYIVIRIPNIIVGVFLALFISFFLFKDGKKLMNNIAEMVPLTKRYSDKLIEKSNKVTYSVVYAHIIVAIVQGILGAIGFYVLGISSALFWGVVMAILSLLPIIGPAIIWIPGSIFLLINGIVINSYFDIGKGIGLLLYGLLIISTSDNFLRVKIIGDTGQVHPLTVLIGIIGGISMFGLIGIFIGPIALSLLIMFLRDFSSKNV